METRTPVNNAEELNGKHDFYLTLFNKKPVYMFKTCYWVALVSTKTYFF